MTKAELIKQKIEAETENIYANEIARSYAEKTLEGKDREEKIKACNVALEKNASFIEFLKEELEKCSQ